MVERPSYAAFQHSAWQLSAAGYKNFAKKSNRLSPEAILAAATIRRRFAQLS
ncbi:MAG TPA: hypothetical protein VGO47_14580 [Chlamydiales bacterium]|nr:hypothetical protein [Chlamydiales bacterium]